MKKKILIVILFILFITTGCTMGNSPTAKVEALLERYNDNADVVKTELGDYLTSLNLNDNSLRGYEEVYLRQYTDMKFNIKDEKITGDNAIVTVEVKVYNYYGAEAAINDYISENREEFFDDNDLYDSNKALNYRLNELKKVDKIVDYTIEFALTKADGTWSVDSLTQEQLEKIHGTYAS